MNSERHGTCTTIEQAEAALDEVSGVQAPGEKGHFFSRITKRPHRRLRAKTSLVRDPNLPIFTRGLAECQLD